MLRSLLAERLFWRYCLLSLLVLTADATLKNTAKTRPRLHVPMQKQFSSVQSLDRLGRRGDLRDDSAQIFLQSFLQEGLVSNFGMSRNVHSLLLSIQHFLYRPRRRPSSKVPWRMVLQRLSWRVDKPEQCKFPSLDICQKRFLWNHKKLSPDVILCGWLGLKHQLTNHKKADLASHPDVGLVLQEGNAGQFTQALGFESLDIFFS